MQQVKAEIVVIGGGAIGTSIACHLAEGGVDVTLVERDQIGSGSTSKAAGGLRTIFSDRLNIEMAAKSIEKLENFSNNPGFEIDFKRSGYLILISNNSDLENFQKISSLQNEYGIPSRIVSSEEAREINPLISLDGILGALYSPTDAQCSPEGVAMGYAKGAKRAGARIFLGQSIQSIETKNNHIERVITQDYSIKTNAVVISAGVWSPMIGEMVGLNIPVLPYKREIIITETLGDKWKNISKELPMTIDFSSTLSWRPEGESLLIGFSDHTVNAGFNTNRDSQYIEKLAELAVNRIPIMAEIGIGKGWAGLYDNSPDNNCILGEVHVPQRLLYATGFSGHGIMQAPAVGEIIRDLYLRKESFVDISSFSLERFENSRRNIGEKAVF